MSILEWLLWTGVIVFAALTIFLVVALARLGRELRQLGEDTGLAAKRLRSALRNIQLVVPAAALAKKITAKAGRSVGRLRKRGAGNGSKKI